MQIKIINQSEHELPAYATSGSARDRQVVWEDLRDYEGKYQINRLGEIRSLSRGRIRTLTPYPNHKGYLLVKLYKSISDKRTFILHRLFAQQFIPNPNNYCQVNHIDGNPKNNKINNLEWVDNRMNMNHRYSVLKNKGGEYGAHWDKSRRLWQSKIQVNGIPQFLGRFPTKNEALNAFYNAYLNAHKTPPWEIKLNTTEYNNSLTK
jgi:hypothetical protein